jgi:hypothetical protein
VTQVMILMGREIEQGEEIDEDTNREKCRER